MSVIPVVVRARAEHRLPQRVVHPPREPLERPEPVHDRRVGCPLNLGLAAVLARAHRSSRVLSAHRPVHRHRQTQRRGGQTDGRERRRGDRSRQLLPLRRVRPHPLPKVPPPSRVQIPLLRALRQQTEVPRAGQQRR